MAKHCIIGNGFIASAVKKRIGEYSLYPTKDTRVIFYLGGVTHMDFEKNPEWHTKKELSMFAMILTYCQKHNIHFIYPSSALVYEKESQFVGNKIAMEKAASHYNRSLGVRIFPVYGPGETKTVIYQWCKEMKEGRRPEIWGDGTQTRDFVFIDDLADALIWHAENKSYGIVDIGHGRQTSFNSIVDTINKVLKTTLPPFYSPAPEGYSKQGIFSDDPLIARTTLEEGIQKICDTL